MADQNLLWEEFLTNCQSQGLPLPLIEQVFEYLMENQFLSQGARGSKQVQLKRLLESILEGQ
jgi:hypothetical protein